MQLPAYEESILHHVRQQVTGDLTAGLVRAPRVEQLYLLSDVKQVGKAAVVGSDQAQGSWVPVCVTPLNSLASYKTTAALLLLTSSAYQGVQKWQEEGARLWGESKQRVCLFGISLESPSP